ncbi:MAG: hypothetical protein IJP27_06620 [Clostridia bacterium]|nr:hypothetical protein [Clostridia bacterium]
MKKTVAILLLVGMLLGLCSCNSFKDTPETDAAFDAYEAAVRQTIAHKKGALTVVTENKDTVENTETLGVIEYTFATDEENKVSFERNDFTNGDLVASYYGDGVAAFQMDMTSGEWVDVTEESKAMLSHDQNYMNTLSLFRIDNQFRYSKHFYQSVTMEEAGEERIVTFTLKNKAVSDMFSFSDEREIRRTQSAQSRSYYINSEGNLSKIVIDTQQDVVYKGTEGKLSNVITVTMNYD